MSETRGCHFCGREFPLTDFKIHEGNRRGWRCRECRQPLDRQHKATYLARHTERERERWHRNARTPKQRARWTVRHAVEDGRLVKPLACESCGATVSLHGHHDDYEKALEVRWLCRPCHEAVHREARHAAA